MKYAIVAVLAAACFAGGCAPPEVDSQLVGTWRGHLVSKTSREKDRSIEAFELEVLPGGRIPMLGSFKTADATRTGQSVPSVWDPGQSARVVAADFTPTSSALTVAGRLNTQEDELLTSATITARLRDDGRLEYRMFASVTVPGKPGRSEALSQFGLLVRSSPPPATQPDE